MADPEKQGPAESRAEDEVMEGAQGGEDAATGDSAAAPAAEEPQAPAENAPKPKKRLYGELAQFREMPGSGAQKAAEALR